jgi:hypothetical protein
LNNQQIDIEQANTIDPNTGDTFTYSLVYKSPHLRSYGNGVYGFEDLPATATQYSNNDFNDAVFALS